MGYWGNISPLLNARRKHIVTTNYVPRCCQILLWSKLTPSWEKLTYTIRIGCFPWGGKGLSWVMRTIWSGYRPLDRIEVSLKKEKNQTKQSRQSVSFRNLPLSSWSNLESFCVPPCRILSLSLSRHSNMTWLSDFSAGSRRCQCWWLPWYPSFLSSLLMTHWLFTCCFFTPHTTHKSR